MMKKSRQNILKIAFAVLLFSITIPSFASAQTIEAKSAAKFANDLGGEGKRIKSILEKKENDESGIVCGSLKNVCDRETEYCLKCSYSYEILSDPGSGTTVLGVCVSKDSVDLSNLKSSFPGGCGKTEKKGLGAILDIIDTSTRTEGVVTLETVDWLDKGTYEQFAYKSTNSEPFKAADGKNYQLLLSSSKPSIAYGEGSGSFTGCEVLPVKLYNMQNCFFCPLTAVVFGASNNVTIHSFGVFAEPFIAIVGVLFALWLALLALKQVFPMTKQDAPKFLTAILKQGFKVALAILLLTHSSDLFRYFIIPVLDGGLQMGQQILSTKLPYTPENAQPLTTEMKYFNLRTGGSDEAPKTLYNQIEYYLRSVQYQLSYMQAIGTSLFCVGSKEMVKMDTQGIAKRFVSGMRMAFLGVIFVIFGFLLTITFAFYFMDALLQLSVIGAMMPLMIAGWPFRATSQYASTGFKMLLNTFFVMFFTGFVVSVCFEILNQSMVFAQQSRGDSTSLQIAMEGGFDKIAVAINEQNMEALYKATEFGGIGFLLIIFSCLMGYKFVAQVNPLAGKLADGGVFAGMTGKIGTMAASSIKGMAGKVSQPLGNAVANKYHDAGGLVGIVGGAASEVSGGVKALGSGVQKVGSGISKAGRTLVAGGGVIGKAAGAAMMGVGVATQAAGAATKAAGTATQKVSNVAKEGAKKVHSAYERK